MVIGERIIDIRPTVKYPALTLNLKRSSFEQVKIVVTKTTAEVPTLNRLMTNVKSPTSGIRCLLINGT